MTNQDVYNAIVVRDSSAQGHPAQVIEIPADQERELPYVLVRRYLSAPDDQILSIWVGSDVSVSAVRQHDSGDRDEGTTIYLRSHAPRPR